MTVKQVSTGRTWEEPLSILDKNYNSKPLPVKTPYAEANELATNTVKYFNATLREGESQRELVNVFFEDRDGIRYP